MKRTFRNLLPICGLFVLPAIVTHVSALQISALDGINRVGMKHGAGSVRKIVEMEGYSGQSQPENLPDTEDLPGTDEP